MACSLAACHPIRWLLPAAILSVAAPSTPGACPSTPNVSPIGASVFPRGSVFASGLQVPPTPTGAFTFFASGPRVPSVAATPGHAPGLHYHYRITGDQRANFNTGARHDNRQRKQKDRSRSPLGRGGDRHHSSDEEMFPGRSKAAAAPKSQVKHDHIKLCSLLWIDR